MIWPVRTQTNGFALVSQSYRNAALAANASIFPAGEAWEQVIRADPSISLYAGDDLHATPAGSFLAAMVIARGLVSLDPARVSTSVGGITLSAATVGRFRTIVAAMPAVTLMGPSAPDIFTIPSDLPSPGGAGATQTTIPAPAVIPTPATNPSPSTPSTAGGSGRGGGAPSGWLLLALLTVSAARMLERMHSRWTLPRTGLPPFPGP